MNNIRKLASFIVLGTAFAGLSFVGTAFADSTGEEEFMNSCASCHGETAAGDGPLSKFMSVEVPALTGLSAANDGVFPMLDVIYTIDGRQGTREHGFPMPVWGRRFEIEASPRGFYGSEAEVRGRILSIAYYLESIQE